MRYLLASAAVLMLAACMPEPQQPTPLITGLGGSPQKIASDFDARIKAQYPVGSNAQALATELTDESFSVKMDGDDPTADDVGFEARREDQQDKCVADWSVSWRASGGNITQVQGDYKLTCP